MEAEIITIGDEILIGQITDTNSAWIAKELNKIGIAIYQITTISDNREHILKTVNEALQRHNIILVTGGLGPTSDDITKKTLAEYFNSKPVLSEKVLASVKQRLRKRNIQLNEMISGQAYIPDKCKALINEWGTAPGMWFEKDGKILVSMPGVPKEMKGIMKKYVIPSLKIKYKLPPILHRTILTYGTFEANLARLLKDFESHLPSNVKLAYLPALGRVRLRLSAHGTDKTALSSLLDRLEKEMLDRVGDYVYGKDEDTLEQIVGNLLKKNGKTLTTAESCTGGMVAHLITSVPGASDYFLGSVVSYSNDVKINTLGVSEADITKEGAVSKIVVEQMVSGVREKLHADYAIAISGIAGPAGGTPDKPVGTVWIAIGTPVNIISEKYHFGFTRLDNITRASYTSLNMLRKILQNGTFQ